MELHCIAFEQCNFFFHVFIMLGLYVGLLSAIASFLGRPFHRIFRTSKPASVYVYLVGDSLSHTVYTVFYC